jgi:hypothetical protein
VIDGSIMRRTSGRDCADRDNFRPFRRCSIAEAINRRRKEAIPAHSAYSAGAASSHDRLIDQMQGETPNRAG